MIAREAFVRVCCSNSRQNQVSYSFFLFESNFIVALTQFTRHFAHECVSNSSSFSSVDHDSAVDVDSLTGDERRIARGQEHERWRNFLRLTSAASDNINNIQSSKGLTASWALRCRTSPTSPAGYNHTSGEAIAAAHKVRGINGVRIGPGATALTRICKQQDQYCLPQV